MFDWDEANVAHLSEHNVLPIEAEQVLKNYPLDLERQVRNGEERLASLGETDSQRVLVVVTAMRQGTVRVVTAFDANRKLRKFYATQRDSRNVQETRDP